MRSFCYYVRGLIEIGSEISWKFVYVRRSRDERENLVIVRGNSQSFNYRQLRIGQSNMKYDLVMWLSVLKSDKLKM